MNGVPLQQYCFKTLLLGIVGQWNFCLKRKHGFSEIYDDYHIVLKAYLHEC